MDARFWTLSSPLRRAGGGRGLTWGFKGAFWLCREQAGLRQDSAEARRRGRKLGHHPDKRRVPWTEVAAVDSGFWAGLGDGAARAC